MSEINDNPAMKKGIDDAKIRGAGDAKGKPAVLISFAAAAVVSVVFARDGLWIPAGVFGVLLLISCLIPVRKEVQLILSASCGFPLLIFAAYPLSGAVTLLFLMTGLFYLAGQKLCVKSCTAFVVCAALGGLIILLSQVFAALGVAAGIAIISAYCIFVRIFRMKKSLKVNVL